MLSNRDGAIGAIHMEVMETIDAVLFFFNEGILYTPGDVIIIFTDGIY